jgi:hypothetical protein
VLPEVADDIDRAFNWYEKQQRGLGKRFVEGVSKQLFAELSGFFGDPYILPADAV